MTNTSNALVALVEHFAQGQLIGFMLILARLAPLFFFAPLFNSTMLPARIKTVIAIGLAIGLTPVALNGHPIPTGAPALAGLLIESLLVGFGLAFTIGVLFAAVQAAGGLVDATSGFSFGQQIDPLNGSASAVFAQLYGMLGALTFLMIGGDGWLMRGMARSFQLVPITGAAKLMPIVNNAESAVGSLLLSAVEVSAPVLIAVIVTDVAFGVISRVVPQLNVFGVGFPMKVGVTLLTVSATLPFIGGWISNQLSLSVSSALQSLQVL